MSDRWGTDQHVLLQVPSKADDPRFRTWYAKKTRAIAGPAAAAAYFRSIYKADARSLLPAIHVPTLILHRQAYAFMPLSQGEYLRDHIEGARLVELRGGWSALLGGGRGGSGRGAGVPDGRDGCRGRG